MNHVDLFSGIGGFALAARNVWGKEYNNVCFCEINKYAQAVLRKNFGKDVVICEDIRALKAEQFGVATNADGCGRVHGKPEIKSAKGSHEAQRESIASVESSGVSSIHADSIGRNISKRDRKEGQVLSPEKRKDEEDKRERSGRINRACEGNRINIDLLTGGFPCQPFSQAGQRRGTEDDRFLWPQMLRVISEFRPTWIIGENVAGILSMAEFDGKPEVASETDLFGNKYDIHTKQGRGILFRIIGELEQIGYSVQTFVIPACAVNAPHRRDRVWIVAHITSEGLQGKTRSSKEGCDGLAGEDRIYTNTGGERLEGHLQLAGKNGCSTRQAAESGSGSSDWETNWLAVATRFCGVDDGLPGEMDGATLSKAGHRVERLKALGNAIVPQVAEQIMKAIKEIL